MPTLVILFGVAVVSWLGAIALAARASKLRLPWSRYSGGPGHRDQRDQQAAVAHVWSIGLGALSTIAVAAAMTWALVAPG